MRSAMATVAGSVALTLLLSGCAADGETPATVIAEPRWVTPDLAVLAEGTFRWHETGTGVATALEYYDLASQAIAHPCVWDGNGGEEVYFNNLKLPTGRASQALGEWSGNLSVALDWTDQDWLGGALRIAYQAPGLRGWHETPPIERGSALTLPIRVQTGNATGDGEDGDAAASWSVWVCFPEDAGFEPQQPFMGSLQAKVVFQPDPVLESELAPVEQTPGRTARDGTVPTQPAF